MTGLATIADLQTLMKKTFAGDDLAQAELVLDIVSAWARVQAGQSWPDAPDGVPSDVRAVVLAASRRELKNPDRVITRQMGPFNVTFDKPPPAGFFYPGELAILGRFRRSGGLRTVGTTRGEHGRPWAGTLPPEQPWGTNPYAAGQVPYTPYETGSLYFDDGDVYFPCFAEQDPGYEYSARP